MSLSLFPSDSLAVPLKKAPSEALAYLDDVLHEQPRLVAKWPSEQARLTGSITSGRIVLRLGTRHRGVVFEGRLADDERVIRGVFNVSLPERLLFALWCVLLGALVGLGVVTSLFVPGSANELRRCLAVALAMLILGFFATRLSWLGRRSQISWIVDLIRRSAQPARVSSEGSSSANRIG